MNNHEQQTEPRISLPDFLKILTENGMIMKRAMAVAGRIFKEHNTFPKLCQLTESKLASAGVDKADRKPVLSALRAAGYTSVVGRKFVGDVKSTGLPTPEPSPIKCVITTNETEMRGEGLQSVDLPPTPTPRPRRKRKRSEVVNEFIPDEPKIEPSGSSPKQARFDIEEVLDEKILLGKKVVTNRAPLMTAWVMVVAERMGFQREEALSIASSYTEINAKSKGTAIGKYKQGADQDYEAMKNGTQPYVEIMGRRPLYKCKSSTWLALSKNEPISPSEAYNYVRKSFKQTLPYVLGALRLLVNSFPPSEVGGRRGLGLYVEFRPNVDGWGAKGEVKCADILALRREVAIGGDIKEALEGTIEEGEEVKPNIEGGTTTREAESKTVNCSQQTLETAYAKQVGKREPEGGELPSKKLRSNHELELFEAELEMDTSLQDVDLSQLP